MANNESPRAPLGETMRSIGYDAKQLAKDVTQLGIDSIKSRVPTDVAAQAEKAIQFTSNHPKASISTAIVAAGLLLRHHRRKKNNNIGRYSATIARGSQSAPSGSAAGMNNAPSAWIQPNGAGYDNPAYQGAKYGFTRGYPMAGTYPTMSRPMSNAQVSRMRDYRYGNYDVAQDQRLSSMI